jgi:hypothetical protein
MTDFANGISLEVYYKGLADIQRYDFPTFAEAAHFLGLLQYGVQVEGEMYMMVDHHFDASSGDVIVKCSPAKAVKAKEAAEAAAFQKSLGIGPAFKMDDGDGGGFLN